MSDTGILIPPNVLAAQDERERLIQVEAARQTRASVAERFRCVVLESFREFAADIGVFEQTTHGSIRGRTIRDVADAIVGAYDRPSSFNISELSQALRTFARVESRKPPAEMRSIQHTFTDSAIALARSVLDGNHEAAMALADEVFEHAKGGA